MIVYTMGSAPMIIDAHAHIFPQINGFVGERSTAGLRYGKMLIGNEEFQLMPPLGEHTVHTVEMMIAQMNGAGVDRAVLMQGPFYGECNDYVLESVRKYPRRLTAMAYLDPWEKEAKHSFSRVIETGGFSGIKLECSSATGLMAKYKRMQLASYELQWLWTELERRRLTLALDLGKPDAWSYQTAAVRQIANRHPELKIVIAHLGQPSPQLAAQHDTKERWIEQIELGLLPNVWFDTAALPAYYLEDQFPFPSVADVIKEVINRIGADKVMWGTDIPGLLTTASYPQLVDMAKLHFSFLHPEDSAKMFYKNAIEVYGGRPDA